MNLKGLYGLANPLAIPRRVGDQTPFGYIDPSAATMRLRSGLKTAKEEWNVGYNRYVYTS